MTDMRTAIDTMCIYEVGGNIISSAITKTSISRNEIEELKELEKKDGKNSHAGVINPETFFVALKQVGVTLGLEN